MSIYSTGRKSFTSQRSSRVLKTKSLNTLMLCDDLKKLLQNFVNHKESKVYEDLVCSIRDSGLEIKDKDLIKLIKEARGCISLLDRNVHLFVKVLLIQKWSHRSQELAEEYEGFLLDLCSAHIYHTTFAIDQLVNLFKPAEEDSEWEDGMPSAVDELSYKRVHAVLKKLLRVIPMSSEILMKSLVNNFPYLKRSAHEHECYLHNLLNITEYQPNLRRDILHLTVTRLIALDTNAPRKEIEQMDIEMDEDIFSPEEIESWKCIKHPEAHTLDICMDIMFRYLEACVVDKNGVLQWDRTKSLFFDLLFVFENVILPTFALQHVQFLLFKFINLKPSLYNMFLQFLWNKVMNPSLSPVIRQAAVGYIASLLSRANFISLGVLKEVMLNMAMWIHNYIANQDLEQANPNMFIHGVFYNVSQALFYLVAFRHRDFVETKKNLVFLQSLNLSKMVTCHLNPLRVCLPQIVKNFASVTRTYQLAYCFTIIEHNARNTIPVIYRDSSGVMTTSDQAYLDTFFPFDPYLLQRSNKFIKPLYRMYDGPSADDVEVCRKSEGDDEDDFLMDPSTSVSPSFSYGSSPGFNL